MEDDIIPYCVLESLKFYGIRSFDKLDETEYHEIKFHPIITIIKGRNGSGKTTAIECLVFGLTGKLSSCPERLPSFINGMDRGQVAEIIIQLSKGGSNYKIHWSLQRPNKDIQASCKITLDERDEIHEKNNMSAKKDFLETEAAIKEILNVPSGAVEKLLLVPQEDTFWPFGTANNIKKAIDLFLNLQEDNTILEGLVEQRQAHQANLKDNERLLKSAIEKDAFLKQAQSEKEVALKEQKRLREEETRLEKVADILKFQLDKYKEMNVLVDKVKAAENINEALKIPMDGITADISQESLNEDMNKLRHSVVKNEKELKKETELKQELEKAKQEIHDTIRDVKTRAQVKQEHAQDAKSKMEHLSQSMSQDPVNFEMDIPRQIEEHKQTLIALELEQKQLLTDKITNKQEITRIETILEEDDKSIKNEETSLKKLENILKGYTLQDMKLSILEETILEFEKQIESHRRLKRPFNNQPLDQYNLALSAVLKTVEELGRSEGSLTMNEGFIQELQSFQSADLQTIIQKRIKEAKQLKDKIKTLKDTLKTQNANFEMVKQILFEEVRLELVSDLVDRYTNVSNDQENGHSPAKKAKLDGTGLAQEIKSKQEKIHSLKTSRPGKEADLQRFNQNIKNITESIDKNQSNARNIAAEMSNLQSSLTKLQDLKVEAENVIDPDETQKIIDDHDISMTEVDKKIDQVKERIAKTSESQTDLEKKQKQIKDLIDALSKINDLKAAKTNLQRFIENVNALLAAQDLEPLPDSTNLANKISNMSAKLNQNQSQLKIMSANLAAATKGVNEAQKNINKFPNATSNLGTLETLISTLRNDIKQKDDEEKEKRSQIVTRHQNMIQEINLYLQDHWSRLYAHNDDIPTILLEASIKSEGNKRVDYNYHFKMKICGRNEDLQMRGRSSFGEKILAAFIIRCALAQKFAGGCPIVAFDEPQGSLDSSVVENLTNHFSTTAGSNQVIVTSYNEDFCNELAEKCGEDGYTLYVIDKENGNSRITEEEH